MSLRWHSAVSPRQERHGSLQASNRLRPEGTISPHRIFPAPANESSVTGPAAKLLDFFLSGTLRHPTRGAPLNPPCSLIVLTVGIVCPIHYTEIIRSEQETHLVGTFWFWKDSSQRRLFGAVGLYYLAENMWQVLLLWRILTLTHSALWMGGAVAAYTIATLAVGIAGPHWGGGQRISTLAVAQAFLMAAGLGLALHSAFSLIILAVTNGWLAARIVPSLQAFLMRSSPVAELSRASAAYEFTSRTGMLLGPLIAGAALAALPLVWLFAAIMGLFITAAFLIYPLGGDRLVEPHLAEATHASGFADTLRIVRADPFLTLALTIRGLNNFLWPAFTLAIPFLALHTWHAGAFGYGTIRSVWGFSTVLGTVWLVPRLTRHLQRFYFLSWALTGMGFLALALSAHFTEAVIVALVGALGSPVVHIALDTHIGRHIEAALQGRLFALQQFIMSALALVGLGATTLALSITSPQRVLAASGSVMVIAALTGLAVWSRQRKSESQSTPRFGKRWPPTKSQKPVDH